ncbi:MAG: hypothetical protein PVH61_39390 [Candidatus Aminicenantes bacterium]|jgi:hypothetical protein
MKAKMVLKCAVVIVLLVFFWGCSVTLPNISPFAEQTRKMVSAVDNGYTHAETLLSMMEEPDESSGTKLNQVQEELSEKVKKLKESKKEANDKLNELQKNWKLMKKVLNALVIYSNELAALADAGSKGEEAANGVVNALDGIITVAKGAFSIPENVLNAFIEINKTIAKIRGRYALKKAVKEAQPVINKIVEIIFRNLEKLEKINNSAGWALRTLHRLKNQPMSDYYEALMESQQTIFLILTGIHHYERGGPRAPYYLKDVIKLDKTLLYQVVDKKKIPSEESELEEVIEKLIKEGKISPREIEARKKEWLKQHQKIKGEINYLHPRYQTYKAREEKINILTSSGSLILRKGKFAILEYGKAHMKLKKTLENKQRMSLVEFASVIQDVVDAYQGGK